MRKLLDQISALQAQGVEGLKRISELQEENSNLESAWRNADQERAEWELTAQKTMSRLEDVRNEYEERSRHAQSVSLGRDVSSPKSTSLNSFIENCLA